MYSPARLARPYCSPSSSPVSTPPSSTSSTSSEHYHHKHTADNNSHHNSNRTSKPPAQPGQFCECGYLRTPTLIRYDCTTSTMAKERTAFMLATVLMGAMFAVHRAYLPLSYTDFNFTLALLLYVPLLNAAILRCGPTSTSAPAANRLVLRLLFLVTVICSLLGPTVLLVMYPSLSGTGMARHLWLVLSQLLLESASVSISQQNQISVLVRIVSTSACIMYRLPVARSWWLSTNYAERYIDEGVPIAATTLCRMFAAANFFYWGSCLFWYIIPLALNASSIPPANTDEQSSQPARLVRNMNRKRPVSR